MALSIHQSGLELRSSKSSRTHCWTSVIQSCKLQSVTIPGIIWASAVCSLHCTALHRTALHSTALHFTSTALNSTNFAITALHWVHCSAAVELFYPFLPCSGSVGMCGQLNCCVGRLGGLEVWAVKLQCTINTVHISDPNYYDHNEGPSQCKESTRLFAVFTV